MKSFSAFSILLFAISLTGCFSEEASDLRLDGFEEWAEAVSSNDIDKTVDAYVGEVAIVPTEFEYVILKAGDRDDPSIVQTFALALPNGASPQGSIIQLAKAQVVRDKSGNIYIQDLNEPRGWRFSVRDSEAPVRFRPGVGVIDIRLFTSATSNSLPQDASQLQAMRTVFTSRARALGLSTTTQIVSRSDDGGPGGSAATVDCDCVRKGEVRTCDAGGTLSNSCSVTKGNESCTVSCSVDGYACCNILY